MHEIGDNKLDSRPCLSPSSEDSEAIFVSEEVVDLEVASEEVTEAAMPVSTVLPESLSAVCGVSVVDISEVVEVVLDPIVFSELELLSVVIVLSVVELVVVVVLVVLASVVELEVVVVEDVVLLEVVAG